MAKQKGDGNRLPENWGECDGRQWWPFAPVKYTDDLGLKACIFDNTGDGDFYKTSVALNSTWTALGNRAETHFGSGGHCMIHSHADIVNCMDDGTGRLLSSGPVPSPSPTPTPSPSPS